MATQPASLGKLLQARRDLNLPTLDLGPHQQGDYLLGYMPKCLTISCTVCPRQYTGYLTTYLLLCGNPSTGAA